MVANGVISFSKTMVCLKDKVGPLKKEWCIIHLVSAISIPIDLGPLIQQEHKRMRRGWGLCLSEGDLRTFVHKKTLQS